MILLNLDILFHSILFIVLLLHHVQDIQNYTEKNGHGLFTERIITFVSLSNNTLLSCPIDNTCKKKIKNYKEYQKI